MSNKDGVLRIEIGSASVEIVGLVQSSNLVSQGTGVDEIPEFVPRFHIFPDESGEVSASSFAEIAAKYILRHLGKGKKAPETNGGSDLS
ncbi:hypothetical protein [Lysinibacter sp. HNR]|uniref:hypothetical protein n=1 Tax=Lysinibacter sp. HNR TaxID=3031408 RepID=UPI0024355012|nr:hypothetical protein [Lysinibacter sp. HNR]WGD38505.1 hypothetical protein FrondiHNR_06230 [Lysinibacter sp. HNR]